jgi:hypothetical protein
LTVQLLNIIAMSIYNHIDEVVDDSLDQYIDSWFEDEDATFNKVLTEQEMLDMQEETDDLPF